MIHKNMKNCDNIILETMYHSYQLSTLHINILRRKMGITPSHHYTCFFKEKDPENPPGHTIT